MKNILIAFLLLSLFSSKLIAQDQCKVINLNETDWCPQWPNPNLLPDPLTIKTINLSFWRVCESDGNKLDWLSSDQEISEMVGYANSFYLPYKIQFRIVNIGEIWNTVQANEEDDFFNFSSSTPASINIYFVPTMGWLGLNDGYGRYIKIQGRGSGETLSHELGHAFGLRHTFETACGIENIVRESTSTCIANHLNAGDFISDTDADCEKESVYPDNCGNINYTRPIHNIMAYVRQAPFVATNQQVKVMHWHIETEYNNNLTKISDDVAPLRITFFDQNNSESFFPTFPAVKMQGFGKIYKGQSLLYFLGERYFIEIPSDLKTISDVPVVNSHKNWDDIPTEFKLKNTFIFDEFMTQKTARYNTPITATFSASALEGAPISSSPFLSDPWYADANGNQDLGLLPVSGAKGVFKDQLPQTNTSIPYYQIKADQITINSGLSFSFQNWTSNGTRPIILNQSSIQPIVFNSNTPSITANYKAMLASKTTGWVGNQFASNNGTSSVMYVSDGKLWLHRENGSDKKEILVSSSAGSIYSYSVTANSNNRYWVLNNGTTTPVCGYELNGVVGAASVPSLSGLGSNRIEIVRLNNATPKLALITKIGSTIYKSIGTLTSGVVTWGSWSSLTVGANAIQVAGNGDLTYVAWIQGSSIFGYKLKTDGTWSSAKVITTSSSGSFSSMASAVDPNGNLYLTLVRANTQTQKKDFGESAWYINETTMPFTVLSTSPSYGDFTAVSLSCKEEKRLASVGVSTYVPYFSYYLWKNNGDTWEKETSSFSSIPQKLLHGETDFRPMEVDRTTDDLNLMTMMPVTFQGTVEPPINKITTGTEDTPALSISGMEPTDTLVYNVNMNPAIVDSIIIDTLGVWSIAVKGAGFVTETVNDLKLFGSSELVVTTTESGTSRTIKFIPNLIKWDVWVVDPSGNKVRMGKEISEEESESESIKTEVAVYPNPFNPETRINIRLAEPAELKVKVYNVVGQLVADLANGHHDIGDYSFRFDGKNLASGTYFYRVEIGEKVKTGKLQLLK